jgi:2Fe-2S ferredoxin
MRTALNELVPGILGDCGGELSCATCHVFVDPDWIDAAGPRSEDEDDLLETTSEEPTDCSRLSCQLKMSAVLDGIVVTIPASQR